MMRWDVSKIKDYDKNFPSVVDENGKEKWNNVTVAITWYALELGIPEITPVTALDFYARMCLADRVTASTMLISPEGKQRPITMEEIKNHIGLRMSVTPKTELAFIKQLTKDFIRTAKLKAINENKS